MILNPGGNMCDHLVDVGFVPGEPEDLASPGRLAASLRDDLFEVGISAQLKRADDEALDLGAVLTIALNAPSVVVLAKTLHDWAVRKNVSNISMTKSQTATRGTVTWTVENIESRDVADVAVQIQKQLAG